MPVKSLENSHSLEGEEVTVLVETEEGLKEMKMVAASFSVSLEDEDENKHSIPLNETYKGSITVECEKGWIEYVEKLKRIMLFQKAFLDYLNGGRNSIIEYYQNLIAEEMLSKLDDI